MAFEVTQQFCWDHAPSVGRRPQSSPKAHPSAHIHHSQAWRSQKALKPSTWWFPKAACTSLSLQVPVNTFIVPVYKRKKNADAASTSIPQKVKQFGPTKPQQTLIGLLIELFLFHSKKNKKKPNALKFFCGFVGVGGLPCMPCSVLAAGGSSLILHQWEAWRPQLGREVALRDSRGPERGRLTMGFCGRPVTPQGSQSLCSAARLPCSSQDLEIHCF